MKPWIVITSINSPTKAIRRIQELVSDEGWRCVVVGDRKTPANWTAEGVDFLSYDQQLERYGELARRLPANHYCRKNLGYLHAMEQGADLILDTDDDNIPNEGFGRGLQVELDVELLGKAPWINVYRKFTDSLIWPRGNPLDSIHEAGSTTGAGRVRAPIQQFLADGDPDVDAIYRLLFKEPLYFQQRGPLALEPRSWCAFNSQNTVFFREAFPLLYLPCHVSFRMTDIWRSFVAQAALWSQGQRLAFLNATVVQERNAHDLMKDFRDEVDGYLNNRQIALALEAILDTGDIKSVRDFSIRAWQSLHRLGLLRDEELEIHRDWLEQCPSP